MPVSAVASGGPLAPEIFRLAIEASPSGMVPPALALLYHSIV
jgi:hypothetical protein